MPHAIVVGSGPNGLAAAIHLARSGWAVSVYEGRDTIGGGTRTQELTLPGFQHDVCSAIHPLGVGSPFFRTLPLGDYGLEWIHPELPLAHPFDDGTAAALHTNLEQTARSLGGDAAAYRRLMGPLVANWRPLFDATLGPLTLPPPHLPLLARFGLRALPPAKLLAKLAFKRPQTRALFAGIAAHAIMPLTRIPSAAFGLMLGLMAHAIGWPLPKGGSQRIAAAMAAYLGDLGGEVQTGHMVDHLDDLPPADAYVLNLSPAQVVRVAGHRLPDAYVARLNNYRYGPGAFKVDWALSDPIPWQADEPRRAGTVHIGPLLGDIAASERATWEGAHPDEPYVLVAQQSLFDASRAPAGGHTGWAYCHVPNGSTRDMTAAIESQIERFAPGFRDTILERHTMDTAQIERYNPNYTGGDINAGVQDIFQLFTRPVWSLRPYRTPDPRIVLASAATPPGGGVHGMAGYHAARSLLDAFS